MTAIKERPILMSGEMVLATLKEKEEKTQTRRIIKIPSYYSAWQINHAIPHNSINNGGCCYLKILNDKRSDNAGGRIHCPYRVGDRLWVKEAFNYVPGDGEPNDFGIHYRADNTILWWRDNGNILDYPVCTKQRPSIFMPRWASRILLEITEIRVQRIQDISDEEAMAEGCPSSRALDIHGKSFLYHPFKPTGWFKELWNKINSKRGHGWANNDWVWVREFKRVEAK